MGIKSAFTSWTSVDDDEQVSSDKDDNRSLVARFWTHWVEDGWLLECLSLALGCVLLLVLCLVLKYFDRHAVPDLGSSLGDAITLNTIVAILGTTIQACLLYPVAECLSQLKWQWLLTDRKLDDVYTFDKASRGPTGSLNMLWSIKWAKLGTLGALLIISAVSITPFLQQLISTTPQRVRAIDGEGFARSSTLLAWRDSNRVEDLVFSGPQRNPLPTGMRGVVQAGLFTPYNYTVAPMAPTCSTGNCTFDAYQSLGICASFANLTSLLQYEEYRTLDGSDAGSNYTHTKNRFTLGSGYSINTGSTPRGMNESTIGAWLNMSSIDNDNSLAFKDVRVTAADVYLLVSSQPREAMAIEFVLRWCVQHYETSVTNGVAMTQVRNEPTQFVGLNQDDDYEFVQVNTTSPRYVVQMAAHEKVSAYFSYIFNGSITYSSGDIYATSGATQAIFEPLRAQNTSGLQTIVGNIATSMTNYMREPSRTRYSNHTIELVDGTVWKDTITINIRWAWIAGPLAFAFTAIVFVAATITSSKTSSIRHAWKSSSAAMMHALEPNLQRELSGLTDPSQLRREGENLKVRLVRMHDDRQWRIVARSQTR